jgi:hypothetical protein
MIPYGDKEIPEELWEVDVDVELSSYQPAEHDVGINTGYYEDIRLSTTDDNIKTLLDEHEEYLVVQYNDELQEDNGSNLEPSDYDEPPEPNFENTQSAGWWI